MAKIQRTRCNGTLTEAGLKGRIISWLRKGSIFWKPRQECIKNATKGSIINEKTGRPNQAVECAHCKKLICKKDIKVDHLIPVSPLESYGDKTRFLGINWNEYIERMFVEVEGFQCLCPEDHKILTDEENLIRREFKKKQKEK